MSRQNVETVQDAFDAYYRRDMERVAELADPELVVTQLEELPDAQTFHGPRGFVEVIDSWEGAWEDLRIEILRMREIGPHVLATVRQRARGRGSGIDVEAVFTFVFTLKAGKFVRWSMFADEAKALEAVGGLSAGEERDALEDVA
jgi:ketosteroid isomerase-like protein